MLVTPSRIRLGVAVALALTSFLAPSTAGAANRYAAPGAIGPEPCAESDPCALEPAIEGAMNDDWVIVKSGSYGSPDAPMTSSIEWTSTAFIRGEPGQPRPVLHFDVENALNVDNVLGAVHGLEIRNAKSGAIRGRTFADRVVAYSSATDGAACEIVGGSWHNTICHASGANGPGMRLVSPDDTQAFLRHVTAWASGENSAGLAVSATGTANVEVDASNTIVSGMANDAMAETASVPSSTAKIRFRYSSVNLTQTNDDGASMEFGPGNSRFEPLLANPAGGDFHQLPGSPTIDAGENVGLNGTTDFEGTPRALKVPDIGADEFVPPPTAVTGDPASVTRTSATLTGSVNPHSAPTTYRFEYGRTPSYGQSTPEQDAGSGIDPVPASAGIANLVPGTTYHYRLVATSGAGASAGSDRTFTTQAIPPPVVSGLKLDRKVFAIGTKLPLLLAAQAKTPVGTTIRFTLNEPAAVKLIFYRRTVGRLVGKKCRAPSRANTRRRRCTRRLKAKPSVSMLGRAGLNRVRFQGQLDGKRKLGLGPHEVAVVAVDGFGRSSPVRRASFRIARR